MIKQIIIVAAAIAMASTAYGQTLTFKQGDGGSYSTTDCAGLYQGNTTRNFGTTQALAIRNETNYQRRLLLRFPDIIGENTGQIPPDSTITSATVYLRATSTTSNSTVSCYRVLVPWGEGTKDNGTATTGESCWAYSVYDTAAWTGCPADGTSAASSADSSVAVASTWSYFGFDVTASVQAWADGANNYGWVFHNAHNLNLLVGTDDYSNSGYRPYLTVTYFVDSVPSEERRIIVVRGPHSE